MNSGAQPPGELSEDSGATRSHDERPIGLERDLSILVAVFPRHERAIGIGDQPRRGRGSDVMK